MENFALISLVEQLKPMMQDVIIRRVLQHQSSGFIFQTRSSRVPAFKILLEPQNPALYVSDARPRIETPKLDFLMVLRKHFTSAELVGIHKALSERIVEFSFRTTVPSKELETMSLVVELLPNAPNLILLDAGHRVLSSFLPITPQHGIGEYDEYRYPEMAGKIDLGQAPQTVDRLQPAELESISPKWLIQNVAGIGPALAQETVYQVRRKNRPLGEVLDALLDRLKAPSCAAWIYTDKPLTHIIEHNDLRRLNKAIISPIELESLARTHSSRWFANILEAARFYFDQIESQTLLEQAKLPVLRDLRAEAHRLADRQQRLESQQRKFGQAADVQRVAQMLVTSGAGMDQHYPSVRVTDYLGGRPEPRDIEVDSALTLRENVERMFKHCQKANRGKSPVTQQVRKVQQRRAQLEDRMRRVQAIKDWDTWFAVTSRLARPPAEAGISAGRESPRPRYRTVRLDGHEVLVGRSGRENDELTFRAAAPDDFWFHVAGYTGSHVIVRNPGRDKELDTSVQVRAAQLATYYSQARNSSKVEVHYTKCKHVTKPKRARAGLVHLQEFKSVIVEPRNWLAE